MRNEPNDDDILDMVDLAAWTGKQPGTMAAWCRNHGFGEVKGRTRIVRGKDLAAIREKMAESHQGNNEKRMATIAARKAAAEKSSKRKTRKKSNGSGA